MTSFNHTIAFVGLSGLLREGMLPIITSVLGRPKIVEFNETALLNDYLNSNEVHLVIIDASLLTNSLKTLNFIKKTRSHISIIAIQYQYVNPSFLQLCDEIVTIDQTYDQIIAILRNITQKNSIRVTESKSEQLSDRELEVLKLLVGGCSAKEIADKLKISVNTVISHRKNISQKTGIKSLAGLTIYAVANKFITM